MQGNARGTSKIGKRQHGGERKGLSHVQGGVWVWGVSSQAASRHQRRWPRSTPLSRLAMAGPAGGTRRTDPLSCYAARRPEAGSPQASAAGRLAAVVQPGSAGSLAAGGHGVERAAVLEPGAQAGGSSGGSRDWHGFGCAGATPASASPRQPAEPEVLQAAGSSSGSRASSSHQLIWLALKVWFSWNS